MNRCKLLSTQALLEIVGFLAGNFRAGECQLKTASHIAPLICLVFLGIPIASAAQTSQPTRGDGIFTPAITPVASIDKTGRPMTVEVRQPEPRLAGSMIAGNPTGDSYVIHFPQKDAGGPCIYTGTARYLINSNGALALQILANCRQLRRGYSYMVCNLDATLRCREAPWWYFRGRTYAITNQGVVVDGSTVHPWQDASEAPQQLQKMAANIQAMNDRFKTLSGADVVHARFISCRVFHPETKSYEIREYSTTCLMKSPCNGMPNVDSLRNGDPIDWNSPAGNYVKGQSKTSDLSNWVCWMRTQ